MKKNLAGQKVGAQMITAADGTAFTGSVTVSVTGDAGTQATGSVGSGACTHEGNGYHTYAPAQAETNYDLIAFTFTGTGAIPATVQVYTLPTTGILAPATAGRTLTVSASGLADANAVQFSGSGTAADRAESVFAAIVTGVSDSGSTTTMVDAALTQGDTDYWKGSIIYFLNGTISGQARLITGFNASTDTITFAPAVTQTVSTQQYAIIPAGRVDIGQWLGTTVTGDGDWNELQTDVDAILADTNELQTDDIPGALSAIDGKIDTAQADLDTITGSDGVTLATAQGNYAPAKAGDEMDLVDAPNATAVTAIQNGVATASALATTDGKADAIKAKTDGLTFTVTGQVDANAESMNGTEILGNGTSGNLWRGS